MEGRGVLKKKTGHSRSVGGRFNEQGSLLSLILGSCKISSFSCTILPNLYLEILTGFS